ncbi:integration host factor subunit alpha [Geobacter sp. OR-1]|uniref:integration host factor subunit alpha n=1 Tax=Geobacter sp. OR-1 TaxID=1266765 RepID=UPI000543E6CF|nr:integration host factor subunit alpha [Geobacter sp. OR-1]GAM09943.1 integration host factor subunit alpha [Geobacter sp. OR-1]
MTKADMVQKVSDVSNLTLKEAGEIVEAVLDIMKETLEKGETLKISGFGNFVVKQKQERKGRNPQTGESITLDARRVLTFKPSNLLRNSINE